jgi:hypothetical protein
VTGAEATLPPLAPLRRVGARLDAAGIVWGLGGSGLMHALRLADTVRDWDLTVDAAQDLVHATLADLAPTLHGNFGIHADHKVVCFGADVEVICRFAFFGERGVIHIPTIVTRRWNDIPIGSPEAWAVAYALMIGEKPGRAEKAAALFAWVEANGPDPEAVAMLSEEPLPEGLAEKVRALAKSLGDK